MFRHEIPWGLGEITGSEESDEEKGGGCHAVDRHGRPCHQDRRRPALEFLELQVYEP